MRGLRYVYWRFHDMSWSRAHVTGQRGLTMCGVRVHDPESHHKPMFQSMQDRLGSLQICEDCTTALGMAVEDTARAVEKVQEVLP